MKELCVQHLQFHYPRSSGFSLDDISFSANAGEVTALIGSNGAGKTTLIKAILGLVKAEGNLNIAGKSYDGQRTQALTQDVSYLTQENSYLSDLTVFEVVLMGMIGNLGLRIPDSQVQEVWKTLRTLHMESLADRPFYALSGGQRRVVGIAQAIIKHPKVLILDEPTANLDMQNELEVMELVVSYTKGMHITTLVTLHDLNLAARFSDRLVLLKGGHVYAEGTPAQVITEDSIREAYGVRAQVSLEENGIPHVHPLSSVRQPRFQFL